MIEKIKHGWAVFQEAVYRRSQEVRVPIKELGLSKKAEVSHFNACWFDGNALFMIKMMMCFFLLPMVAYAVISSETFVKFITGTVTGEEFLNGVILLGAFSFISLTMFMKLRWVRRSCLAKLMLEIKDNDRIKDLFGQHKWLYVTPTELVFTNVRSSFLFRVSDRFPTNYPWGKPYRRDPISWFGDRVIFGGLYLRILWPYFFNSV